MTKSKIKYNKIHPIVKLLQRVEIEALNKKYFFAIRPINKAINEVGYNLAHTKEE